MSILSGVFSSDESGSSSDLLNVLDGSFGIDASNSNYEQTVDDDGSSHTSANESHFSSDLDVGSILSNMSDNFSDSDHGGGFFG